MSVLFASGDVGGARALLPVIEECGKRNMPFAVLENGWISSNRSAFWRVLHPLDVISAGLAPDISVVVFASSVSDDIPLRIARMAKEAGRPVMHVLDHWTSYRRRLETDGGVALNCDVYAVMDDCAAHAAEQDGIEKNIIRVTGHPGFASLSSDLVTWGNNCSRTEELQRLGFDPARKMVLFVSEPAEKDQGGIPEKPSFRGYTEKTVLELFCRVAEQFADEIDVGILAHPREDSKDVEASWLKSRGPLRGRMMSLPTGRQAVFVADCVVGMASILLYEGWLCGKPVISIQPNLRQEELKSFARHDGIVFVDSAKTAWTRFGSWMQGVSCGMPANPRDELNLHKNAVESVMESIESLLCN